MPVLAMATTPAPFRPGHSEHSPDGTPDWTWISRTLLRIAGALTGNTDDAEELTQRTLAALLAKAPHKVAHLGYARRSMLRLWLDEQRSLRRRFRALASFALVNRRHADDTGPETRELARRVINTLPPVQRAVLVLRLVEGLTSDEIATSLDIDVRAVRSNLHLARARICNALKEHA